MHIHTAGINILQKAWDELGHVQLDTASQLTWSQIKPVQLDWLTGGNTVLITFPDLSQTSQ